MKKKLFTLSQHSNWNKEVQQKSTVLSQILIQNPVERRCGEATRTVEHSSSHIIPDHEGGLILQFMNKWNEPVTCSSHITQTDDLFVGRFWSCQSFCKGGVYYKLNKHQFRLKVAPVVYNTVKVCQLLDYCFIKRRNLGSLPLSLLPRPCSMCPGTYELELFVRKLGISWHSYFQQGFNNPLRYTDRNSESDAVHDNISEFSNLAAHSFATAGNTDR